MGGHPLIAVGFLAFFVVALVVGVRLVLLWTRTRQLPELLIGVGVLGIGPVGFGASVAAMELEAARALYPLIMGLGQAAVTAGVVCKLIFNWRVYHPESRWIPPFVQVAGALMVVVYVAELLGGFADTMLVSWRFCVRSAIQVGALLWGSGEALRYWTRMRRRVRLGLADPVVSNRFLLWGVGAGAAGVGSLIGIVAQIASGGVRTQIPWVLASSSGHGLVAAVCMWLAFVPPAAWRRFVASRARAEARS